MAEADDWRNPGPYRRRAFTVIGTPTTGQVPTPIPSSRWYRWGTPSGAVTLPAGFYLQDETPSDPDLGDIWVTITTLEVSVFGATGWVPLGALPDGLYFQDDEPSSPNDQDIWITETTLDVTQWDDGDSEWDPLVVLPDGIYIDDVEPVSPTELDLWITETTKVASIYVAGDWYELGVPPDGVYVQDAEPASPNEGDTWITVTIPSTWRYLSGAWVEYGVVLQGVYVQYSAPAVGVLNDIWIDREFEGAGPLAPAVKRFNGVVWAPYVYSEITVAPGRSEYEQRAINDGCHLLFMLDEASGQPLDSSGSFRSSGYYSSGGITRRQAGPGASTYAHQYSGGVARVSSASMQFDLSNQLTIEAWVYLDSFNNSANRILFTMTSTGAESAGTVTCIPNAADGKMHIKLPAGAGVGQQEIMSFDRPAAATWFFLSVTIDRDASAGNQITVRINGVPAPGFALVQALNVTGAFVQTNMNFMGAAGGGATPNSEVFTQPGKLWGLALYDFLLSDGERDLHAAASVVPS